MKRRFTIETTLYGKRSVSRTELYQLHREVSRAASVARQDDPKYVENQRMGAAAAAGRWG